jgi:hypothetical protein
MRAYMLARHATVFRFLIVAGRPFRHASSSCAPPYAGSRRLQRVRVLRPDRKEASGQERRPVTLPSLLSRCAPYLNDPRPRLTRVPSVFHVMLRTAHTHTHTRTRPELNHIYLKHFQKTARATVVARGLPTLYPRIIAPPHTRDSAAHDSPAPGRGIMNTSGGYGSASPSPRQRLEAGTGAGPANARMRPGRTPRKNPRLHGSRRAMRTNRSI